MWLFFILCVFFFNDTATTEIYTLSLHDALPIWVKTHMPLSHPADTYFDHVSPDRKSTRLNSSHDQISYAVFCLKKKKINNHAICKNKNIKNSDSGKTVKSG